MGYICSCQGVSTSPNLEWKWIRQEKIVFAFSNQHQCLWALLVSHRAACLLCFIENFLPASPAARERGRRGGTTQIQRLICLLVKRNSRPHFLMRALIKSEGVWPENGSGGGGAQRYYDEWEIRFLPSTDMGHHPASVKPQHTKDLTDLYSKKKKKNERRESRMTEKPPLCESLVLLIKHVK